jgi:hypothetical protein
MRAAVCEACACDVQMREVRQAARALVACDVVHSPSQLAAIHRALRVHVRVHWLCSCGFGEGVGCVGSVSCRLCCLMRQQMRPRVGVLMLASDISYSFLTTTTTHTQSLADTDGRHNQGIACDESWSCSKHTMRLRCGIYCLRASQILDAEPCSHSLALPCGMSRALTHLHCPVEWALTHLHCPSVE